MDEVPCLQGPLLLVDDEQRFAGQDEEVLLSRLGVVAAVRLARLQHAERDTELREELEVPTPEGAAVPEGVAVAPPGRVARIDDEPARAVGLEPALGLDELRFLDHAATLYTSA